MSEMDNAMFRMSEEKQTAEIAKKLSARLNPADYLATRPQPQVVPTLVSNDIAEHPLFEVFCDAIKQAMYGKGGRHGGNVTPFLDQPWVHYGQMHGRGFLTGQAAKKLEEASSTREGEAFETEVLGCLVYAGMAILKERKVV